MSHLPISVLACVWGSAFWFALPISAETPGANPELEVRDAEESIAIVHVMTPAKVPVSAVNWGNVSVRWDVLDNYRDDGSRFASRLTLVNESDAAIPASGWTLYFSLQRAIATETVPDGVEITHINGDFYRLDPAAGFSDISPGEEWSFTFEAYGPAIKVSDAPSGFYVVEGDQHDQPQPLAGVEVGPFEEEEQWNRSPFDEVPFPSPVHEFRENDLIHRLGPEGMTAIVPTPASIRHEPDSVTLNVTWTIHHEEDLVAEVRILSERLARLLGESLEISEDAPENTSSIRLRLGLIDHDEANESYELHVTAEDGIEIIGASPAGVYYGVQSLISLAPPVALEEEPAAITLPGTHVLDAPRFSHRGLHLDVSRHFQPVEAVERLLDVMSFYKLNRFHFHLTDDEGWRVEIRDLPELTEVGGYRGHTVTERDHLIPSLGSGPDPSPEASYGSGYYDRDEYVHLLQYAHERHIEVIPEIDVPGHARAAIVAMKARHDRLAEAGQHDAATEFLLHEPEDESNYISIQRWTDNVINVCIPSTYRFMETVIDELQALHEEAGVPLNAVHIGGDEVPSGVWTESPACQELMREEEDVDRPEDLRVYFIERVTEMLNERGLTAAGWEEVALVQAEGEAGYVPNPDLLESDLFINVWANIWGGGLEDRAYELANAGYKVVLSHASNLYFDLAYSKHPEEPGFYWAGFVGMRDPFHFNPFDIYRTAHEDAMGRPMDPETDFADHVRLQEEAQPNILGIQGQLWSETLVDPNRMEYMAFPRTIGLAERAWAPAPDWAQEPDLRAARQAREEAWNEFANQLGQRELPRLDHLFAEPIQYRLPPPGAEIRNDILHANTALPGLAIRYTTDGTEPTAASTLYTEPVQVNAAVRLRTFNAVGRGSRTIEVVPEM